MRWRKVCCDDGCVTHIGMERQEVTCLIVICSTHDIWCIAFAVHFTGREDDLVVGSIGWWCRRYSWLAHTIGLDSESLFRGPSGALR